MPEYSYPCALVVMEGETGEDRLFVVLENFNGGETLWRHTPGKREPAFGFETGFEGPGRVFR